MPHFPRMWPNASALDIRPSVSSGPIWLYSSSQVPTGMPASAGTPRLSDEKSQVMIHIWKRGIHNFGRHELGQHFLHPDVVEPFHRDEVAEPHMRRFVRDGLRPIEHLGLGCGFVQKDPRLVIEDGAGMFHAAELK